MSKLSDDELSRIVEVIYEINSDILLYEEYVDLFCLILEDVSGFEYPEETSEGDMEISWRKYCDKRKVT